MFKIDKDNNFTIRCSRGDSGTIDFKISYVDDKGYLKYEDGSDNVYWYDVAKKKLYDEDYEESSVDLSTLTLQLYEFQVGDVVRFNIYEKKGYDQLPIVSKDITISSASDTCLIPLYESDTTFGEISNKEQVYWYDITLNEDVTLICYDENNAKEFIQYPAKGDEE